MYNLLIRLLITFFVVTSHHVLASDEEVNLQTDKSGWVDLFDPFNSGVQRPSDWNGNCDNDESLKECKQEIEKLVRTIEQLRSQKTNSVDVLLKHILRQFFLKLDVNLNSGEAVDRHARVHLSEQQVAIVVNYLESQKESEEIGRRERLREVLENFLINDDPGSGLFVHFVRWLPYLCFLNVLILPLAILVILKQLTSMRRLFCFALLSSFCCSYYFTYIRKYQEVLASRFARSDFSNDHCAPKGLVAETVDVLLSYVKIKGKNRCLQSHEDMLIEPFLLVDPLQVFGEVITNFIMSPFSVLGLHLNKFFADFFIDTPIHLTVVKLVFILLVLFYFSGYRIRTIFGSIEPAENRSVVQINQVQAPALSSIDRINNHASSNAPNISDVDSWVTRRRNQLTSTLHRTQSVPRLRLA